MSQSIAVHPYLFFGGNCRKAMEFYQAVFGGELTFSTYADGPPDAHQDPKANSEEMMAKIMHARLTGDIVLLGSDSPHNVDTQNTGQFSLSIEGSDEEKLETYFGKLSEEGQVSAPLIKQFWGDTFGMVTDRYGITWMISIREA